MTSTFPITNRIGVLVLCTLMVFAAMPMTACQNIDQQIQIDGAAIAASVQQIAAFEQKLNADYSAKLSAGATALLAATQSFVSGTLPKDIASAATAIQAILALIPQTAPFAALVPIAAAALETLLANLPGLSATTPTAQAHVAIRPKSALIKHRLGRSIEGDFKAAWNSAAVKVPGAQPIS